MRRCQLFKLTELRKLPTFGAMSVAYCALRVLGGATDRSVSVYIQTVDSRVEMCRGSIRFGLSVSVSFVQRCLNNFTITPFTHPPHRTGHADFPHPALGQDFTPSSTTRCIRSDTQDHNSHIDERVDSSLPCCVRPYASYK